MTYDPRMLQMARMGVGMMGPQASPFDRANQPRQWWEQPANQPANPAKQPQPSLLQMLMLGGPATYSGTPKGGASPWGWLGGLGRGTKP